MAIIDDFLDRGTVANIETGQFRIGWADNIDRRLLRTNRAALETLIDLAPIGWSLIALIGPMLGTLSQGNIGAYRAGQRYTHHF